MQESEGGFNNPYEHTGPDMEDRVYDHIAQMLDDRFVPMPSNTYERFGIKRLKALGATMFEGTVNPANAKK